MPRTHGRAAFGFIFVTVMLDWLALGVVIPVLPKLIIQFEHGDMAVAAHATGIFSFIFAAMQFLFAPVIGSLSDRFGRRPIVLLSNFGMGCDYIIMALAPQLRWLFVGRVISGIMSSSFPTASAYLADVTPPETRAAKFGQLGAAFGLGFILGPALGGVLGGYGLRWPFWAAGVLSLLNFCYGLLILPESLPAERRTPFSLRRANPLGSLKLLRSHPELFGLATALFLYFNAHESLPSMFVLYTDYRYNWGARLTGIALAAIGAVSSVVSAVLVGWAVKRFGDRNTLFIGMLFGIAGFCGYAFAPNTLFFIVAACPLVSLWGLASPPLQSLMTRQVSPSEQGQLQGANSSLLGIAGMIAPLIFTSIFAYAISPTHAWALPGAPYWLAAALLTGSLVIAWSVTSASSGNLANASAVD